jgi:prolyl oligopeptidase
VLVYDRPDQKEWGFGATVTDDGRYLIIAASQGHLAENRIFYKDLSSKDAKVVPLLDGLRRLHLHRQRRSGVLVPHRQTRRADASSRSTPASRTRANWKQIVPESGDSAGVGSTWSTTSWCDPT